MKIERISENSIKCTLTSFDLSVRNMNLKELAYGSDKARMLFKEMMNRANEEVGFNVENTSLMIEAIPMSGDSIQLVITKVDDPEEIDPRFSKFSQNPQSGKGPFSWVGHPDGKFEGRRGFPSEKKEDESGMRAFAFESLDGVIEAAAAVSGFKGHSTLYRKPNEKYYVLVLDSTGVPAEIFSKVANIVAEYGKTVRTARNSMAYYDEHYKVISAGRAVQKLAGIK